MRRRPGNANNDAPPVAAPAEPQFGDAYPIAYRPTPHEIEIEAYFSEPGRTLIADRSPFPVDSSIVICFVNRSGSTWLADLLAATKKASRAGEILNSDFVVQQCRQHAHESFDAYLRSFSGRAGRRRYFAFKAGIGQLHFLRKRRIVPDLMPKLHYILCRRKDIAAQALSLIKAAQTLEWRRFEGQEFQPFDYDSISNSQILDTMKSIVEQYAEFELYFSTFGIDYNSVTYEELVRDTHGEIARVTRAIGIDVDDPVAVISGVRTSVVQRDEASELRLRRFHATMNRC